MTVGTVERRGRGKLAAPPVSGAKARGWIWAVVQLAVLGTEVFATLFLLAQPAFRPQQLAVSGNRHVTADEVKSALDLPPDRNLFFLNPADLERRVSSLAWVKSASVSLALPDRITVKVQEWKPSAVLQVGESTYTLNDAGQVLDPASEAGSLPIINRPDLAEIKRGQRVVSSELMRMLLQLNAGFQPAFKISIKSFTLDGRDVLTAQTDRGWTIIFGQMVTAADRSSLEPKLASLRALGGRLDLTSSQIVYVNLENPGAPSVQMRGKR